MRAIDMIREHHIMGEIIRICLVGLIVGIIARFIYPGEVELNWVGSILLGIGGSVVGGYLPRLFNAKRASEPFSPAGFIGSVLGAMLLIFIVRAVV
jgi:uncharacterized membrane protein YeaQ/YmgE (transglycosylase-associated protein family)